MKNNILLFLFACISLLFSACETDFSKNKEYPNVTADDYVLKGTLKHRMITDTGFVVSDWKFGASDIKMIAGNDDVLAKGIVKTDGTFELLVPGTVSGTYFFGLNTLSLSDGGTLIANPETVRVFNAHFLKITYLYGSDSISIYPQLHSFREDFTVDKVYTLQYFDREGAFSGTAKKGNIYNWSFKKGWQWVESYPIGASTTMFESKTVDYIPANVFWTN